jgi:DNA-binding transcriptional LysR family regulator
VVADHADLAGLQSFPFCADRLVLIVPSEHALAGRERIAFADALGFDFVGLSGDSALHQHLVGHAARAGGHMRLRARVRGLDVVCRMVALGAGVAVIPEAAAGRWRSGGSLAVVRLEDSWTERQLLVVVRRLDSLSSHARRLVEHLVTKE